MVCKRKWNFLPDVDSITRLIPNDPLKNRKKHFDIITCPAFGRRKELGWVTGLSPNVRIWDLGLRGECTPWRCFLRDPSPYLLECWRKPRKNSNCQVGKCHRVLNLVPPATRFERRTTWPLAGTIQKRSTGGSQRKEIYF